MKMISVLVGHAAVWCVLFSGVPVASQQRHIPSKISAMEEDVEQLRTDFLTLTGGQPAADARARLDQLADDVRSLREAGAQAVIEKNASEAEAARLRAEVERLAAEVKALSAMTAQLKAELDAQSSAPLTGYDSGFFVRSGNGKFLLKVGGWVRPKYTLGLVSRSDSSEASSPSAGRNDSAFGNTVQTNSFEVESARLEMSVQMFQRVSGVLSVDFGTLRGEVSYSSDDPPVTFMDAYGEFRVVDAFWIRGGQFKVPFDLETAYDDGSLVFSSRSLMTRRYFVTAEESISGGAGEIDAVDEINGSAFGRDVGAEIGGAVLDDRLVYHLGVWNGAGIHRENDNRDVLIAGRIAFAPLGSMSINMSDIEGAKSPRVSAGLGAAYDLPLHRRLLEPDTTYNSSDFSATFDAALKWRGLSAFAAVFYRYSDHGAGLAESESVLHSLGAVVQAAYYISSLNLEPAVRYSVFSARLGRGESAVHEATAGVQYYVYPEHLRFGIEYRGVFPTEDTASYIVSNDPNRDASHEIGVSAEVKF